LSYRPGKGGGKGLLQDGVPVEGFLDLLAVALEERQLGPVTDQRQGLFPETVGRAGDTDLVFVDELGRGRGVKGEDRQAAGDVERQLDREGDVE
jgi:hypothetical protein